LGNEQWWLERERERLNRRAQRTQSLREEERRRSLSIAESSGRVAQEETKKAKGEWEF
jgi:hypothetical protein